MYRQPAQSTNTVSRLQGMHDLSEDAWRLKQGLQDRLCQLLSSYGYQLLETPVLEPTELFLRKSGGELASQLYSFTDAGSNAVSLRPEFTSPIMRHYLENVDAISLPARWQYSGPVFRFDVSHPEVWCCARRRAFEGVTRGFRATVLVPVNLCSRLRCAFRGSRFGDLAVFGGDHLGG